MVKRKRKAYRNASIYHMRQDGATYRQIADFFELSICRVRQIIETESAREAAGEAEYWAMMGKEFVRGIKEGIKEVSSEYEKEAADV